jgi:transmembrane sensor
MKHFGEDTWEFIRDDHFNQWVRFPDAENTAWWEQWMADHPERLAVLEKARNIVLALATTPQPVVEESLLEELYASLDQRIQEDRPMPEPLTVKHVSRARWWWAAAAVVAGITMVSVYLKNDKSAAIAGRLNSHIEDQQLIRVNTTNASQIAWLTDGSSVVLKAGASIKHDAFLQNTKREVYLKGDAFFDIAKDASRPFLVYTKDIGIRVLGTSFNVSENNGNLTVSVKTGKISVYQLNGNKQTAYEVTPNHQIRFNAGTAAFITDSLNNQELAALQPDVQIPSFSFENTPVTNIFAAMETAYSIKISANEAVFGKCMVTTNLTNQSFENKLKIICAAINASYTIRGGQVFITGKPCS